jgi:hypothetical protein
VDGAPQRDEHLVALYEALAAETGDTGFLEAVADYLGDLSQVR